MPRGLRQAMFQLPPGMDVPQVRAGFMAFFKEDAARRYDPPGKVKVTKLSGNKERLE